MTEQTSARKQFGVIPSSKSLTHADHDDDDETNQLRLMNFVRSDSNELPSNAPESAHAATSLSADNAIAFIINCILC